MTIKGPPSGLEMEVHSLLALRSVDKGLRVGARAQQAWERETASAPPRGHGGRVNRGVLVSEGHSYLSRLGS